MIYIVFSIILCTVTIAENSNKTLENDEDRWIWGYVDVIEKKTTNEKANGTTNDEPYDPCKPYNPEKPSFKASGWRISEEKCQEYMWEIITRQEQIRRGDECQRMTTIPLMVSNAEVERGGLEGTDSLLTRNKRSGSDYCFICGAKIFNFVVQGWRKNPPKEPHDSQKVFAVAGGAPVFRFGQYPHMGALGWKTKIDGEYVFKCGSTLISRKFVLTAAHCSSAPLDDIIIDSSPKIVRLKSPNLLRYFSSTDVNIICKILHPNYKPPKQYYDIALMELEYDVIVSDDIQPACLWTKHDVSELGLSAKLTGWGVLRFGSRETSPDLQAAEVNFIDSKFCDELLSTSRNRNWQGLAEHQLCAGKLEGGVDACQGDSGGPLQVIKFRTDTSALYNVIGVTSFGIGCAQPNLPGIYTRVSSFIDWIENIVWKDSLQ